MNEYDKKMILPIYIITGLGVVASIVIYIACRC